MIDGWSGLRLFPVKCSPGVITPTRVNAQTWLIVLSQYTAIVFVPYRINVYNNISRCTAQVNRPLFRPHAVEAIGADGVVQSWTVSFGQGRIDDARTAARRSLFGTNENPSAQQFHSFLIVEGQVERTDSLFGRSSRRQGVSCEAKDGVRFTLLGYRVNCQCRFIAWGSDEIAVTIIGYIFGLTCKSFG